MEEIRQTSSGLYHIMLARAGCAVLAYLLDPAVPYVWVVGHRAEEVLRWWRTQLPLAPGGPLRTVETRLLQYDLLMETNDFLGALPDFERVGIRLYQMTRRVPNTLMYERLTDEAARTRVLIQNGLHATFYLPHAGEIAMFAAVERATIERALQHEAVRAIML